MNYIMQAWNSAIKGDENETDLSVSKALELAPSNANILRIAARSYELLGNETQKKAMENKILSILPEYWNDPESENGRILRKENPWLIELDL